MLSSVFFALLAIIVGLYYFSKRKFNYWKDQNVPYAEPTPILGNYGGQLLLQKHVGYVVDELCKKFPDEPYFGAFMGTEPTLIVKDPAIIKLVTTKDFYYFNGREVSNYNCKEPITANVFNAYGDQWKVVRQNLTPVFTSAKMKNMFHLIVKCSHEFEKLLDQDVQVSNVIEVRDFIARFTMACIGSCAFGIDSDTMSENYKENPFTKVGNSFIDGSKSLALKGIVRSIWPKLFYFFGFELTPKGANDFFVKFMTSVFEARNNKPTNRNDFVDFILTFKQSDHITGDSISNMKTGENKKVDIPVTDDLLSAQCFIFFLAGFETSATTTSYTLFELAKHPEALEKCQEEIDAYLLKHGNKLTYECVTELPYTEACVDEALRLYPVVMNLTREVMEDYTLPSGVRLEKGVRVHLPIYHMHKNPKYFPEPEVFRPERFLGEAKRNIQPHTYMPFGDGARICIGMRFAKMQILSGMVTLMKKYSFELDTSTPKQVTFDPQSVISTPSDPLRLKLIPREGWERRVFVKA